MSVAPAAGPSPTPNRWSLLAVQAFVVAILALSLFLALVVPFHATDALVYGQWSRYIGEHGGRFLFDAVGYPPYSRPLYYAPQGWLWAGLGAHEWIGRLESLLFYAVLLWSVFRLGRDRSLPPYAPWLALLALFACPDVVVQAIAGQTDVPVAAMIALVALLLWRYPARAWTAAAIVLVAALAVLSKATALPALVGLGAGFLLGDRAGLTKRITFGVVPLAAGTLLGLVYGVLMARHFGLALNEFLGGVAGPANLAHDTASTATDVVGAAGSATGDAPSSASRVGSAVTSFTSSDRPDILLRIEWLGPYVRMIAVYALVYAIARVVAVPHRIAAFVALGLGLVGYWIGPSVLAGGAGVLDTSGGALVGSVLLIVPLAAVAWCPPEQQASRLLLARLLTWGIPPLLAWGLFGILGDTRTLSPAWPALFVLLGAVVAMGVAALSVRSALIGGAAVVLLLGLALLDFRNYDGLGSRPDGSLSAIRGLKDLTPGTWTDATKARSAADPQLGGIVADTRTARRPGTRVWSNDGRQGFYFLGQTTVAPPPQTCDELRGYGALSVLLNGGATVDTAQLPCLTPVRVVPGSYAVYRVQAG
jgi:hypothetical protein